MSAPTPAPAFPALAFFHAHVAQCHVCRDNLPSLVLCPVGHRRLQRAAEEATARLKADGEAKP